MQHKTTAPSGKETKTFQIKELSLKTEGDEAGTFEGYLAVFGNKDLGGDIIHKGAFNKTLSDWRQKGRPIPLLWQHDMKNPVGAITEAVEDDTGLKIKGKLTLAVQQAKEAYALMKDEVLSGLSIGYKAINPVLEGGARQLKELRLFEGSLVTYGMNPEALITGVKEEGEMAETSAVATNLTFDSVLAKEDLSERLWKMQSAYRESIWQILREDDLPADAKVAAFNTSTDQFAAAMKAWAVKAIPVLGKKDEGVMVEIKGVLESLAPDSKAGRVLSTANRGLVEQAITALQALLSAATPAPAADGTEAGDEGMKTAAKAEAAPDTHAAEDEAKALEELMKSLKANTEPAREDAAALSALAELRATLN